MKRRLAKSFRVHALGFCQGCIEWIPANEELEVLEAEWVVFDV